MERKKKYRCWIIGGLILDLAVIIFLGYRELEKNIPDEIRVEKFQEFDLQEICSCPFVEMENAVTVSKSNGYSVACELFGFIPYKTIKVIPADREVLHVSGSCIGLYMETEGVLIIDAGEIVSREGIAQKPAENIVRPGDYIVAFNEEKVSTKHDLMEDLKYMNGEKVTLKVEREGKEIPLSITPVKDAEGNYKLGIWVRDDTQGIGTLTFIDQQGNYGALGHGISDVDTGELLKIHGGNLYGAEILGIQKGEKGNPGELSGLIYYETANVLGSIRENTSSGIYGRMSGNFMKTQKIELQQMPIAYKQEIQEGEASILCCVEDQVKEYQAEIKKIELNQQDTNKSFVIQVTDEGLIKRTGGIIQGLSGSPIIQNGKLVGAVTHVLVNDPTRGYGIFIENMLNAAR